MPRETFLDFIERQRMATPPKSLAEHILDEMKAFETKAKDAERKAFEAGRGGGKTTTALKEYLKVSPLVDFGGGDYAGILKRETDLAMRDLWEAKEKLLMGKWPAEKPAPPPGPTYTDKALRRIEEAILGLDKRLAALDARLDLIDSTVVVIQQHLEKRRD